MTPKSFKRLQVFKMVFVLCYPQTHVFHFLPLLAGNVRTTTEHIVQTCILYSMLRVYIYNMYAYSSLEVIKVLVHCVLRCRFMSSVPAMKPFTSPHHKFRLRAKSNKGWAMAHPAVTASEPAPHHSPQKEMDQGRKEKLSKNPWKLTEPLGALRLIYYSRIYGCTAGNNPKNK